MHHLKLLIIFCALPWLALAAGPSKDHLGNWLLVNGLLVIQFSDDDVITFRNTGVSAKAEFAHDGSFTWKPGEEPPLTGRFQGNKLLLKNTQPNMPAWIEYLEFRQADEKVANEVIEVALRQQTAALASLAKVRESSIRMRVLNNLRQLAAAADQYFLENGVTEATLDQLVGPDKYLTKLEPADNEDYKGIKFNLDEKEWKIVTASGVIVTYSR